jgi:hypothetical protein
MLCCILIMYVKYINDVFQEHQGASARERAHTLVCERVRAQERVMLCADLMCFFVSEDIQTV